MGVNKVFLMGRLTKDPEMRTTQSGVSMCKFTVAIDRYTKGDEKKADFIDCIAWRNTADIVSKYFHKGKMIHVEGNIQNNNYTDQNGIKRYQNIINADSIAFCGDSNSQNNSSGNYAQPNQAAQQNPQYQPNQAAAAPYQNNAPAQPAGDLNDFETILGDGEVPF